jgi:hypothetical protein
MDSNSQLHVRFGDNDSQGSLMTAAVTSKGELRYILRFDCSVQAEVGTPLVLFHHIDRRFYTQDGEVQSICRATPTETLVTVQCGGEPVPAENRANFRATTAGREMTATIGRERKCEVVNVSAQGLAAMMSNPPQVGATVEISIEVDNKLVRGSATLRNANRLSCRRYKCGFEVQDKQLARALNQLCMAIQREQLRRLARA